MIFSEEIDYGLLTEAMDKIMFHHCPRDEGYVYFISDGYYVKIGFSKKHPKKRLRELQTGNYRRLTILDSIVGSESLEREIHKICREEHFRGEWFTRGPIVDYILSRITKGWWYVPDTVGDK